MYARAIACVAFIAIGTFGAVDAMVEEKPMLPLVVGFVLAAVGFTSALIFAAFVAYEMDRKNMERWR